MKCRRSQSSLGRRDPATYCLTLPSHPDKPHLPTYMANHLPAYLGKLLCYPKSRNLKKIRNVSSLFLFLQLSNFLNGDLLSFPILALNIQSEAPPSWWCHPWHLGSCCFFTNLTSTCQPHRVTMADSQREEHEVYAPHWTLAMCHRAWLPYSVQLDLLFKPAACLPLVDPPCSNHFIDNHQLGNLPH